MTASDMFLLDIEEEMRADRSGELRRSMVDELLALQATLQQTRRQLNSRERYREVQAALLAVDGAIHALGTLRSPGG